MFSKEIKICIKRVSDGLLLVGINRFLCAATAGLYNGHNMATEERNNLTF